MGAVFHGLPTRDPPRCRIWLRAIQNPRFDENTPANKYGGLRVCSLHFKPEDYEEDFRAKILNVPPKPTLKSGVVPSVFPGRERREDCSTGDSPPAPKRSRNQMHITIQQGRTLPELVCCQTCCRHYHCPFCSSRLFNPTSLRRIKIHLENHFNRAINHEGYTIHRCGLGCREQLHYHCFYCSNTLVRRADFQGHLKSCMRLASMASTPASTATSTASTPAPPTSRPASTASTPAPPASTPAPPTSTPAPPTSRPTSTASTVSTPALSSPSASMPASAASTVSTPALSFPSASTASMPALAPGGQLKRVRLRPVLQKKCPICQLLMNIRNLKRHIERRHTRKQRDITATSHLRCKCIDPENGMYSVQRLFFGKNNPHHVQNKVLGDDHHVFCDSHDGQISCEAEATTSQLPPHPPVSASDKSYCIMVSTDPLDDCLHSEPELIPGPTSDKSDDDEDKDCAIVNTQSLLELFRKCQMCGKPIGEKLLFHSGAQVRVKWSCHGGHSGVWKSSPRLRDVLP